MTLESTPTGDSVEVTDVDTAAQALLARRAESDETIPQETDETESESVEQTEELEAEPESEETDAIEEEAEARFETLSELAEATDMDLEDFLKTVKAKVKVQGEESEVTLAEAIKGYQLESDYTRKNEAFLNQQKEWEQQREQTQAELNAELQKAGHAFNLAQQQLTHEYSAIDWGKLQADDPSQYVIKRQEFGERQAQLNQAINQATQNAQAVMEKQDAEKEVRHTEYVQQQDELLLKAIPEWSDQSVRNEQSAKVSEFLLSSGFTPEELASLSDHRIILMARKAMNGDKVSTEAEVAKKKVVKAPKLVKPNARQDVNQSKAAITKKLVKKAKATGRTEDFAAVLASRRS